MTSEGDPRSDEPIPPATTRHDQEPVEESDELGAPFVPGRGSAAAEPTDAAAPGPTPGPTADREPFAEAPTEQGPPAGTGTAEEDDFPFDQFDIEGGAEASETAVETEPIESFEEKPAEPAGGEVWSPSTFYGDEAEPGEAGESTAAPDLTSEPTARAGADAVDEVASLLNEIATRLRNEGPEAVEAAMDSPDRLTSLLSSLLAGYLSGRS